MKLSGVGIFFSWHFLFFQLGLGLTPPFCLLLLLPSQGLFYVFLRRGEGGCPFGLVAVVAVECDGLFICLFLNRALCCFRFLRFFAE